MKHSLSDDRLFQLLPAYYRQLDPGAGNPLRDLLRVISRQVQAVDSDIARSYDDLFVETCQPWVAPYLGDLVGYEISYDPAGAAADPLMSPRADVANAIAFRRRKGTPGVLADVARAVGRWPTVAVELADRVAQFVPIREAPIPASTAPVPDPPSPRGFASVRDVAARWRHGTPFDKSARMVDVRRPNSTRTPGRAHPAGVGVFVYRLEATPIVRGTPALVRDRCYTFDPLGRDTPLFTRPGPAASTDDPLGVPAPLPLAAFPFPGRRHELFGGLYGEGRSLALFVRGDAALPLVKRKRHGKWKTRAVPEASAKSKFTLVPPEHIVGTDLSHWEKLPDIGDHEVAIDPVRGRFVVGRALWDQVRSPHGGITVSYHHGTADTIGADGHPWEPISSPQFQKVVFPPSTEHARHDAASPEPSEPPADPGVFVERLNLEIEKWIKDGSSVLVVEINTSATIHVPLDSAILSIPAGRTLHIRAGKCDDDCAHRPIFAPPGTAPARIRFQLGLSSASPVGGRLILEGLLFADVEVRVAKEEHPHDPKTTQVPLVEHWTEFDCRRVTFSTRFHLDEKRPSGDSPTDPRSGLVIYHLPVRATVRDSILGPVRVDRGHRSGIPVMLDVTDSIWDAGCPERFALNGPHGCHAPVGLTVRRSTVRGRLHTHEIDLAEDSILLGMVHVARRQQGEMRYCYYLAVAGDRTPRRTRCQPEAAIAHAAECRRAVPAALATADQVVAQNAADVQRLTRAVPVFTTTDPGKPGYFRLAAITPRFVAAGASDEGEMGAYHRLQQFRRAARMRARLEEFVPTGFDLALIFAT